jgi:hypothetical protein
MIVQIDQEWTRLETRQTELNRELSEVAASMERLRAIKNAAEGKVVTSARKAKEASSGGVKKRGKNKGAALGQKNRWYWKAKEDGNKEKAAQLLADLRKAGKEPWKVEKK